MTTTRPTIPRFLAGTAAALLATAASAALVNLTNTTSFESQPVAGGPTGTTTVPLTYYTTVTNTQARGFLLDEGLLMNSAAGSGSGSYRRLYSLQKDSTKTTDGYNRDVTGTEFDQSIANGFDPYIRINQLTKYGAYYPGYSQYPIHQEYYIFSLDLNEDQGAYNSFVSMTELQVYVGGTTDPGTLPNTVGNLPTLGDKVWDLQANKVDGTRNDVLINSTLSGSGVDDLMLMLPTSLFTEFDANSYVYIYSSFGQLGTTQSLFQVGGVPTMLSGFEVSDGFEEWAQAPSYTFPGFIPPPALVPEFATTLGTGLVLCFGLFQRRRR